MVKLRTEDYIMIKFAQTKTISVKKVIKAPYNPRKSLHPDSRTARQLQSSMNEFGCVETLVWNQRTGHLVAGNQRFDILLAQGVEKVLVSVVDLPLEQEKQLNIGLNAIDGEWDNDILADLLSELTSAADFNEDLIGFRSSEIDQILADKDADDADQFERDKEELEEESETPPIAQPGEIIELGSHRIACGDCTDPELVARLLGEERVHMLHTDPPYNVAYNAADRPTCKGTGGSRPIVNDKMSDSDYRAFTEAWITAAKDRLVPGAGFYIWNGFANFGFMAEMLAGLKLKPRHIITWAKESYSPGFGDYNEHTEFCLYGRKAGGKRRWYGPKNESTLWSISRDRTYLYRHPTQKALPLAERAIRNSSQRGEIVFDPFLGSGTTLVAAARLGRRCVGIEIEPRYCDVAVRRFIAAAGASAVSPEVFERWGTPVYEEATNGKAS